MKFIWKGKMTTETAFVYSSLPKNAKPLINEKRAWLMYMLVVPILVLAYLSIQIRQPSFSGVLFTRPALFVGVGLALIFLPIHELIHASFCPAEAIILIYVTGAGISLVPDCKIRKKRYIVMVLMPTLILGMIPIVLWLTLSGMSAVISSILFAFSISNLVVSIGDIYNAILAVAKMPKNAVLVTSGVNCYFFETESLSGGVQG